jgi:Ala-tRNA(Pro) deacylase
MPLVDKLRSLMDARSIPYNLTTHPPAIRASEVAWLEHLPAWEVAKTVVVCGDNRFYLIVVPADRQVDLYEVASALDLKHVRLATEAELADLFPECELGAMPPIGILFDLPVYLDSELANEAMITFNAGTHRECIHMRTADFCMMNKPKIVSLARLQLAGHGW